ncbi:uncharacterized protein [Atheta coriaria]|uniref:uncharacterized protein n=1 Tax=Dalotia coriaria TaxID=877792 RepID=UPI0031F41E06
MTNVSSNLAVNDFEISKFWELEELPEISPLTKEERLCEEHFVNTTRRQEDGRFIVSLPLRENANQLGCSRHLALKRFYSLERKLLQNSSLRDSYCNFMKEYEQLGHMSQINPAHSQSSPIYYLPHHPVFKYESSSTKVRVVFDGSAQSDSTISLNEIQMVGPTIQRDLFSILVRFRRFKYALMADIAKMYRQVLVAPENRSLQRILWRTSPDDSIKEYELNTVTYGTASASFLAIRCLKQLALDSKQIHPHTSSVIENDFYVDDLLTGSNTTSSLSQLRTELTNILASAGFELRKWLSNNTSVLPIVEGDTSNTLTISDTAEIKTLGLSWDSLTDTFGYKNKTLSDTRITKRTILSLIGQLFDPLGFLSPIIIQLQSWIMQSLWQN